MELFFMIVFLLLAYLLGYASGESDTKKRIKDEEAERLEKEEYAEWKRAANLAVQHNKPISLFYGETVTIEGKKQNE